MHCTVSLTEAVWEDGCFANQNAVCRLSHRKTLELLAARFGEQRMLGV